MDKKILESLEVPAVPSTDTKAKYVAACEIKITGRKKLMTAFIWSKEDKNLLITAVADKKEFLIKNMVSGSVSTALKMYKVFCAATKQRYSCWEDCAHECASNDLDREEFEKYFGHSRACDDNGLRMIEAHIEVLVEKKTNKLKSERRAREESLFGKFQKPNFPKGFTTYCKDWIDKHDRLFITRNRRNGEYKGYCTHCGGSFSIREYSYVGQEVKCQRCGEKLRLRFNHEDDTAIMFSANVGFFEKIGGYPAVRLFHIYRNADGYDSLCEENFKEYARYIVTDKKMHCQLREGRYGMGNHWYESSVWMESWCRVFDGYFALYNNLKEIRLGTKYKFLEAFEGLFNKPKHVDITVFKALNMPIKSPSIEFLQKQGWVNIVKDILSGFTKLNIKCKSTSEVFGIDVNKVLKFGRDINFGQLELIKKADAMGKKIDRVFLDKFDGMPGQFEKLCKYVNPIKYINFAIKQEIRVGQYLDYIAQMRELDMDTADTMLLFPRNFVELHARLGTQIGAKRNVEKAENFAEQVQKFVKYAYESKDLCIVPIDSIEKLIYEGKTLSHCVGGYVDNIVAGNSIIFALRQKAELDKPFYTVELRPKTKSLVQCRGYKDCSYDDSIRAFLEKWQRKIKQIDKQKVA